MAAERDGLETWLPAERERLEALSPGDPSFVPGFESWQAALRRYEMLDRELSARPRCRTCGESLDDPVSRKAGACPKLGCTDGVAPDPPREKRCRTCTGPLNGNLLNCPSCTQQERSRIAGIIARRGAARSAP
ncbi:MAG: hypothetical protein IT307_12555 [Chloroflexi bacterium]|nr:hypothetical protein [Chloroflexota bacterium]